jgi:hypothetical protein
VSDCLGVCLKGSKGEERDYARRRLEATPTPTHFTVRPELLLIARAKASADGPLVAPGRRGSLSAPTAGGVGPWDGVDTRGTTPTLSLSGSRPQALLSPPRPDDANPTPGVGRMQSQSRGPSEAGQARHPASAYRHVDLWGSHDPSRAQGWARFNSIFDTRPSVPPPTRTPRSLSSPSSTSTDCSASAVHTPAGVGGVGGRLPSPFPLYSDPRSFSRWAVSLPYDEPDRLTSPTTESATTTAASNAATASTDPLINARATPGAGVEGERKSEVLVKGSMPGVWGAADRSKVDQYLRAREGRQGSAGDAGRDINDRGQAGGVGGVDPELRRVAFVWFCVYMER